MDSELIKFLDWLYVRRHQWISMNKIVCSGFAPTPHEITWMVKNDLLNEVTGETGKKCYCISLGGRMKRAEFKRQRWFENSSLLLSVCAMAVSIGCVLIPALLRFAESA